MEGRAGVGDGESARAGPPGVGNMSARRAPNFPAVGRKEPEGHCSDEIFVTHFYLAHWLFHLRALKLKQPWGGFTRSPFQGLPGLVSSGLLSLSLCTYHSIPQVAFPPPHGGLLSLMWPAPCLPQEAFPDCPHVPRVPAIHHPRLEGTGLLQVGPASHNIKEQMLRAVK